MYRAFFILLGQIFYGLSIIFLIFSPTLGTAQLLNTPSLSQEFPTDRLIIKYKPNKTMPFTMASQINQIQRLNSVAGTQLRYLRPSSGNSHVLALPKKMSLTEVRAVAKKLMALPEVEYAEPDKILFPLLVPNDPLYVTQWSYFDPIGGINLPSAWNITRGLNTTIVAVIDTGITAHIDLVGKTVPGYDFITDPFKANDGNGRDNDPSDPGDWITIQENADSTGAFYNCPVENSSWHGTHVSGTIGALSNNRIGVSGVNWNAKIQPVRVLGKCGGYTSDIADGMLWAAGLPVGVPNNSTPAKVLNLSLGGFSLTCGPTLQNAINLVNAQGVVVVVAAGNSDADAANFSPANCSGVISVAATNKFGDKAFYSNYGASVTIAAPGGDQTSDSGILSTLNTGTEGPDQDSYTYYIGTSMATPHVSGIISLMLAKKPSLTPIQIRNILQSAARPFPGASSCNSAICGSGIADANASIIKAIDSKTLTLTSTGAYDGWILESSENSSIGGQFNSSTAVLILGDDLHNKQYRSLLSFNTSTLPDNAIITQVTLKIRHAGTSGTNPFITHSTLFVDIKKPIFGKSVALELTDFSAAPNKLNAATFNKVPVGNVYSAILSTSIFGYINRTGTTQFRLRFNLGDNNDKATDIIKFYSGNYTTSSYRPQLVIQYYVP